MKASLFGSWHTIAQRPHHLAGSLIRAGLNVDIFTSKGARCAAPRLDFSPSVHARTTFPSRLYRLPIVGKSCKSINHTIEKKAFFDFVKSNAELYVHYHSPKPYSSSWDQLSGPFIYDCMDDWDGFTGAPLTIRQWEDALCDRADQIWVVSKHLQDKHSRWGSKVKYVPNGVDYQHFSRGRASETTESAARPSRPQLLYVGTMLDWFDASLVGGAADLLKDWEITLIGPHRLSPEQKKSLSRPNINLLGPKDYQELPELVAKANVAMIPFIINDLIRGTSPIKLYEYLAAGVPVVATPMPEVLPYSEPGVVACEEGPADFAQAVELLAAKANPDRCQEIARACSWDGRFHGALESILPRYL